LRTWTRAGQSNTRVIGTEPSECSVEQHTELCVRFARLVQAARADSIGTARTANLSWRAKRGLHPTAVQQPPFFSPACQGEADARADRSACSGHDSSLCPSTPAAGGHRAVRTVRPKRQQIGATRCGHPHLQQCSRRNNKCGPHSVSSNKSNELIGVFGLERDVTVQRKLPISRSDTGLTFSIQCRPDSFLSKRTSRHDGAGFPNTSVGAKGLPWSTYLHGDE
jgi:hypothetical protein